MERAGDIVAMMTGQDLKTWRKHHGSISSESLLHELDIKSVDTITRLENDKGPLPRFLELTLIALTQLDDHLPLGAIIANATDEATLSDV